MNILSHAFKKEQHDNTKFTRTQKTETLFYKANMIIVVIFNKIITKKKVILGQITSFWGPCYLFPEISCYQYFFLVGIAF